LRCNHAPLRIPVWRLGVHPLRRLCNKLIPTPQPRIWVVQATPPPTLPPWIQPHPHCSIHLCVVSGTVHCVHKTVNFVSGTVNYMSRTLQCVCGTGNFVHTRDEHMYLPANVLSTLESCVSSFSKLQSVPVLSGSGYIFATNFTAWFYHEFFVCSRKYFTVLNFQLISKQFLCISNKPPPLVSSVLVFIRELLWKCSFLLPRPFGVLINFVVFPLILLLYPEL